MCFTLWSKIFKNQRLEDFLSSNNNNNINRLVVYYAAKAADVIKAMDAAIGLVDPQRAGLNALQKRLESSIRNRLMFLPIMLLPAAE